MIDKDTISLLGTIAPGLAFIGLVPAFADSSMSTGPWSVLQEIPSYTNSDCNFSDDKCADATTSGENSLVSRGDNFVWNVAISRNNIQKSKRPRLNTRTHHICQYSQVQIHSKLQGHTRHSRRTYRLVLVWSRSDEKVGQHIGEAGQVLL